CAVLQMRLDLDPPGVETDERMGDRPCEHSADASGEALTNLLRLRAGSGERADEHVLEVLACPPPRPSVHVPPVTQLLAQPGSLQDLRVQPPAIVDDYQDRCPRPERATQVLEDGDDPVGIRLERGPRRPGRSRADLELAAVVEIEQLVRVPMLLVVVDQ